ncbi:MAG: Tex-like N-terminal domain-containing protein, partial [Acidobacteriota bacterium]|nr:Tex-like N-terminal domain-containing protein [Acidobacteriota bacterium]
MKSIAQLIAEELNVRVPQVDAAIALLDDKATVPFIARYRKEATGGLDEVRLGAIAERVAYYEGLLTQELDVELATLGEPLDSRSAVVRGGEAAWG